MEMNEILNFLFYKICHLLGYLTKELRLSQQTAFSLGSRACQSIAHDKMLFQSRSIDFFSYFSTKNIQSHFNGSNIFGTIENCSRHRQFEPLRVNHGATSGGK